MQILPTYRADRAYNRIFYHSGISMALSILIILFITILSLDEEYVMSAPQLFGFTVAMTSSSLLAFSIALRKSLQEEMKADATPWKNYSKKLLLALNKKIVDTATKIKGPTGIRLWSLLTEELPDKIARLLLAIENSDNLDTIELRRLHTHLLALQTFFLEVTASLQELIQQEGFSLDHFEVLGAKISIKWQKLKDITPT